MGVRHHAERDEYGRFMLAARVVGHARATVKHPSMEGWKLLVVQPLEADGRADGDPVLAIDALGAGIRETVIISSDGQGTRKLIGCDNTPVRWSVIGIVDGRSGCA